MLLVANLIKLSSSISFPKTGNEQSKTAGSRAGGRRSSANPAASTPLIPGSRRLLQEPPQSRSKPIYVTKPRGGGFQVGNGSPRYASSSSSSSSSSSDSGGGGGSYVIREERDFDEANVDGWASEFIEKVHKNRKDFDESSTTTTTKKPHSIVKPRFRRASSALN